MALATGSCSCATRPRPWLKNRGFPGAPPRLVGATSFHSHGHVAQVLNQHPE
ncbi:hypothetical protein PM082_024515, partial [Marasmius tenuissimus]